MIRQLNAADAAAYRALRLTALQTEPDAFCSDYEIENKKPELFLEKCLRENSEVPFAYGAFEDDHLVGIAGFAGDELIQLYVAPDHRRRGLARELALAVASHAFREVKLLLYINVAVVLHDKNAQKFYETIGFETTRMDNYKHNGYGIQLLALSRSRHR
ncbi:GNAT family N-acetyltransferase [Mucilaginibacter mali]|uniref:GNAT family N-acetyltransferase n=1 Tax=Mucilaginibacter mali TaxID=2740462 RepID=A0A7D4TQT2_9SPHI|nr:GNAT family N-acetyltransferase [Mucilaginibacter mali]QKJ31614.1 GNAT family N-acetyltransferase [Mucilaginibacter mali]